MALGRAYGLVLRLGMTTMRTRKNPGRQETGKTPLKELWQCPRCGEKFISANMWHSCGKYSLEELFARSAPYVFQLYKKLEQLVQACGPVTIIPQRSRVVFQVRVRFAGAVPRKSHLLCSFGFSQRHNNTRFHKIEQYASHWYGHYCRIDKEEDLDDEFIAWLKEAYEVGEQKHLKKRGEAQGDCRVE